MFQISVLISILIIFSAASGNFSYGDPDFFEVVEYGYDELWYYEVWYEYTEYWSSGNNHRFDQVC